jgi:hypothetical protein
LVPAADTPGELVALGLRVGERVRFRRRDEERWKEAKLESVERDGSLAIRDAKGASRAIPVGRVQVRRSGPRGGTVWVPATDLRDGTEQLDLL